MTKRKNDRSQQIRLAVQTAFVVLNVWIGARFYLWVRWVEGNGDAVVRPPGVEGWLPIAGLMNLKAWIVTGTVPRIHPSGMFLLVAFLAISLLAKKSFCSWVCPVGTLSEWLWKLGRPNLEFPRWLDLPLRGLKYALLAFFLWAILQMPAVAIDEFMRAPFGAIADVKMLNFFRFMSTTAVVVLAALLGLSVAVKNFWCRYLCPYGALLGLVAMPSPTRIRRDAQACIDCGKCTKACPARLPVERLSQVRSAECTLCMSCVAACPVKEALAVQALPARTVPAWAVAAAVVLVIAAVVTAARWTGHWATDLPVDVIRYFIIATQGS